ncbi:hypothetical protein [Nocardia stercoris]|uniref:DUF3558 domain-containing protein n=1 Tax=Nocardia stercoris TaxID=2483361 RepID=A0A3M2LC49_9NOCA|nr:hypothetical protein [Nocardia stercoris]RMI34290.1 hypothetical protein EBN03_07785 [Nocardia stercoris]
MFTVRVLLAAAVLAVLCSACSVDSKTFDDQIWLHGDPDPGGKLTAVVSAVFYAYPAEATVTLRTTDRLEWDFCPNRPGHNGWQPIRAQVEFAVVGSTDRIVGSVGSSLQQAGWSVDYGSDGPAWIRPAATGVAHARLRADQAWTGGLIAWNLTAEVPAVKGC